GLTAIGASRCTVGGGFKMRIAETAIAAMREHDAFARFGQVGKQRFAVLFVNLRADRDLEHSVGAVGAVAILAHSAAAVFGEEMLLIPVINQRVEAGNGLGDNVSAPATVAAVRSAKLDKLFAPKRYAAVSAVAGADIDLGFIKEFHVA